MLKLAAGPQIVPVYGTDFRSTPVFFLQDDHDYFDNDEAFDEIITFPPVWFQLATRARDAEALLSRSFCRTRLVHEGCPGARLGMAASQRAGAPFDMAGSPRFSFTMSAACARWPDQPRLSSTRRSSVGCWRARPRRMSPIWSTRPAIRWGGARGSGWSGIPTCSIAKASSRPAEPKPYWQSGWMKQHDRLIAAMTGSEGANPADHQRRSSCGGDRKDLAFRLAQSREEPAYRGVVGSHRHRAGRMAFGVSRRRSVTRPSTSTCGKKLSPSSNTASRLRIFCRIAFACGSSSGT